MEPDKLTELLQAHQSEVYRYLRYLGAERGVGEDLVQETFVAAFTSGNPPDLNDAARRCAWLRGIARNLYMNKCRADKRSVLRFPGDALERADRVWDGEYLHGGDGSDYMDALHRCLGELPDQDRLVLNMRYTQGKSRAEMAAACNMSEDGIKSLLRRIRADLAGRIMRELNREGAA